MAAEEHERTMKRRKGLRRVLIAAAVTDVIAGSGFYYYEMSY